MRQLFKLESPLLGRDSTIPLLGGDLGVGKAVIREIFTPLERSLRSKGRRLRKYSVGGA